MIRSESFHIVRCIKDPMGTVRIQAILKSLAVAHGADAAFPLEGDEADAAVIDLFILGLFVNDSLDGQPAGLLGIDFLAHQFMASTPRKGGIRS